MRRSYIDASDAVGADVNLPAPAGVALWSGAPGGGAVGGRAAKGPPPRVWQQGAAERRGGRGLWRLAARLAELVSLAS